MVGTKNNHLSIYDNAKQHITPALIEREIRIHCPEAILNGEWWNMNCIFHNEQNPSLYVHSKDGHFMCHGCNEKGDWIDFIAKSRKLDKRKATDYIIKNAESIKDVPIVENSTERVTPLIPIETEAYRSLASIVINDYCRNKYGVFNCFWIYRNAENEDVFLTVRFDNEQGKKIIPFYHGVDEKWYFKRPFEDNFPLYNLPAIIANPDKSLLIVEGEKCCDAIIKTNAITDVIPTTWPFGANNVIKADWEPLRDKSIIIWPDADEAGWNATREIITTLEKKNCKIRIVIPPTDVPAAWDCADAVDEKRDIQTIIHGALPLKDVPDTFLKSKDSNDKNKGEKGKESKSITERALKIILQETQLFSDGETGYALFKVGDHYETACITSRQFNKYIRWLYRDNEGKGLNENSIREIICELESIAIYNHQIANVYGRVGKSGDGNFIINPCWNDWSLIEINSKEWVIKPAATLVSTVTTFPLPTHSLFIRPRGMLPMPYPEKGKGCLNDLRRFIGAIGHNRRFLLIVAFIIQSFLYDGPFPILVILAEPGAGKTFATIILKRLIDPHEAMTMSVPRESRDLFAAAVVSWLMAYDNFSTAPQWLSDIFCRLSTGGAVIDRALFTNGEAYIYSAKRPAIVNGITDFFNQSDVIQRSLIINFNRIDPADRRDEQELWADFNDVAPGIFHDLLDLLVKVLQILPKVKVDNPTRMIDFCKIGTATGLALGFEEGEFMAAYQENQNAANDVTLEASQIFPVLKDLLKEISNFEGTPQELLTVLNKKNPEASKSKYWPKTPAVLSGHLKRLAPNLRSAGYTIEIWRDHIGRKITISSMMCKSKEKSVTGDTVDTINAVNPGSLPDNVPDVELQTVNDSTEPIKTVKPKDVNINISEEWFHAI